ncbi:MAG: nitrilase-related carbon-nitrogen hydrolase [Rhodospirillaceae bacterium]
MTSQKKDSKRNDATRNDPTRRHVLFAGAGLSVGALAASGGRAAHAADENPVSDEDAGRYGGIKINVKPGIEAAGPKVPLYRAACVQTVATPAFDSNGKFRPDGLQTNVDRVAAWIARGADEVGAKLYSFSEFCLQPAPAGASVEEWIKASIEANGPEIEQLGRAAQKANAFVAINAAERIAAFPGRYFLSGMIISPSGDLIVNYRKLNDPTVKTRPGDILPAWLDVFGEDSLFPVADTEIGVLASMVALDVKQPEVMRGFALKGAEVIVNPTASPEFPGAVRPSVSTMTRRVRASENMAYVLLSNLGPVGEDETAEVSPRQPSEIIDFRGELMAAAETGGEGFITATIDIDALRQARTGLGSQNTLGALQVPVHRLTYNAAEFAPVGAFMDQPIQNASEHDDLLRETIKSLVDRGVLKAPGVA